jgi:glycosyltransferase involved in cell wall biosynthesis
MDEIFGQIYARDKREKLKAEMLKANREAKNKPLSGKLNLTAFQRVTSVYMKYVPVLRRVTRRFIAKTQSMVAQTMPVRWLIVDDGSTDKTAEIVESYAKRFPWIEVVRRSPRADRNFAGKVHAFNAGLERVQALEFDVIGNLDGDLSFPPDYLEFLMQKFSEDPELGVGGTPFTEDGGYDTAKDSFEGENHVAGGCQLFRRQCFEEIGGYVANPAGGVDWIAVMSARMKGWKVRSFSEKRFHHYRTLGTAQRNRSQLSSYGERPITSDGRRSGS